MKRKSKGNELPESIDSNKHKSQLSSKMKHGRQDEASIKRKVDKNSLKSKKNDSIFKDDNIEVGLGLNSNIQI